MPGWLKIIVGLAVIAGLFAAYSALPVAEWIEAFRDWTEEQGPVGWIVFILVYAFAVTALVPGSFLTLAAGVAFGLWGFPLVVTGATLGAAMSFLAGRYLVRNRVRQTIQERPKLRAIDAAIGEDGWKIVGLLRLSPLVPFSLQNWVFGATSVSFWPYFLASLFGIMPGTLLYVWIGSLGGAAAGGGEASTLKYVFFGVGILATLVVTVLVGRKANAKLKEHGVADAGDT
jgi:uncharacterized membrane protein YdjX (TVP38/TMEM64 family)